MSPAPAEGVLATGPSSKIGPRHRDRLAVVYIRQSTAAQVLHHQESTRLQYGLKERAIQFGWPSERIMVIDEDLGRTGTSAEGRTGFQRLVAEVGMDHVGMIFGMEISRLARSCLDWYHLIEVCALFGTLISDMDGIYDPSNYNDRLLLGLKGTMSEAEIHVLRQRLIEGKNAKARRGELGRLVPIGYVRKPSGEVIKDPDEQAQAVVTSIFDQFGKRGTVTGVLFYLVEHGINMPVRVRSGLCKGELRWHRPNRPTLQNMLKNPAYAGAYVYGRRPTDPRAKKPGRPQTGKKVATMEQWTVCLRDRLPAYISWEQFEANQKQLHDNRNKARGIARQGHALLAGLVVCGRCGRRMAVMYSSGYARYRCGQEMSTYGGKLCQSMATRTVDNAVASLVLRALEPASLEISLAVAANLEQERAQLARSWQQRLERAQYEVDRCLREYQLIEPENRLVKRTLERQLEERLAAQQQLQEEHRRHLAKQPAVLTEKEREAIRRLATDIPSLWHAETTSIEQKKAIVRQMIDRVRLTVVDDTECVLVAIEWAGGHFTHLEVTRPVRRIEQLSYHKKLLKRIGALRDEGHTYEAVAATLNEEGWRPAKRRETFTKQMVQSLMARLHPKERPRQDHVNPPLREHEWTLVGLAEELSMPVVTLHSWIRRGWVTARKVLEVGAQGVWVIQADAAELQRLRALRVAPKTRWARPASHRS
jgi:DNA invertase Pin-like site-specific DNA recombinase